MATIPNEMDAVATFIAKENGVIAGISLAEMIFNQVDPSLQVRYSLTSIIFRSIVLQYSS